MSAITQLADAITRMEGYYPGTRAYSNNNPGNLRDASGTIWPDLPHDAQGFVTFPSAEAGRAALENDLTIKANRGMTPAQIISVWAPASDGNDTSGYIANVSAWTGLDMNAPMNSADVGYSVYPWDDNPVVSDYEPWDTGSGISTTTALLIAGGLLATVFLLEV